MGLYITFLGKLKDKIKGNKLTKPDIFKPVDEEKSQLADLKELLEEVNEDQKELVQKEIYNVSRGLTGEKRIEYELKNSSLPLISLHDINLEYDERTSQIDFVVITTKCIIVIESKNLFGDVRIEGDNFIRRIPDKDNKSYKEERIYSPVSQNEKHISLIKDLLMDKLDIKNMPIYSLIVFSDAATIVDLKKASEDIKGLVINYDNLKKNIVNLMEKSNYDINVTMCYQIVNMLLENDKGYKAYYIKGLNLKLNKETSSDITKAEEVVEEVKLDEQVNSIEETTISLFDQLKNWRYQKAKELEVKPYYIFNNEVLNDLVDKLPKCRKELLEVYGFGDIKVREYGEDILKIINGDNYINEFDYNKDLFNELAEWRYKRACRFDIDEDYICTDDVLENVSRLKPVTKEDLIKATGFDEKKYKYNGEEMIAIIKKY